LPALLKRRFTLPFHVTGTPPTGAVIRETAGRRRTGSRRTGWAPPASRWYRVSGRRPGNQAEQHEYDQPRIHPGNCRRDTGAIEQQGDHRFIGVSEALDGEPGERYRRDTQTASEGQTLLPGAASGCMRIPLGIL